MGLTSHWDEIDHSSHEQTNYDNESDNTSSVSIEDGLEDGLEDIQCLFCDRTSSDLGQNLSHMSTAHGLHVVTDNLIVDVGSLLSYFHLVVSVYHECLFCGIQRNTCQAIRQHMIAKRHCKYDITAKDNEFRDFYDFSSSEAEDELARRSLALRLSDHAQLATQDRTIKSKRAKRSVDHNLGLMAASKDQPPASSSPKPHNVVDDDDDDDDESSDNTQRKPESFSELSTRAQKQTYTLNNQLAQLRADDRRSLMHLPVSQQRALLATHHKQVEKARRSEQTQRGNLESAGNSFGRLGTIRLIRQPPHTGRVQTLKR